MDLKRNQVVIFKNWKKVQGSKDADYKGHINVEGVMRDISIWNSIDKNGKQYFSGLNNAPFVPTNPDKQKEKTPQAPPPDEYKQSDSGENLPF